MADSSLPYISHHPPTMTPQVALTARNSTRTSGSTSSASPNKPDEVDIFVGGHQGEHFTIDFALLQGRSPMLEYALTEYGGVLQLPEEDADVFHDYLKCLKYGAGRVKVKIPVDEGGGKWSGEGNGDGDGVVDVFAGLPDVWIMADKLEDLRTANDVVDEIQRRHINSGRFPGAGSIDTAFAETTTYSPLRRLFVDLFVLEASPREYEDLRKQDVTPELWFAVAHEMRRLVEEIAWGPGRFDDALGKTVDQKPRCDYHLFDYMGCASCSRERGR